jgi:hypothetical protein
MSITITGPMTVVAAETLGRQRAYQWADLDRLQVVYIGPAHSLENFQVNSPHPDYPLMFVISSQERSIEGGLTELNVTYEGKFLTGGQKSYISKPVISESPVQGSRDFIQPWYTPIGLPGYAITGQGPSGVTIEQLYNFGTKQLTVRYVGSQCSIRYQAYPRPTTLHYSSLGLGLVSWRVLSQTDGPTTTAGQGYSTQVNQFLATIGQIPPLYAANLGVELEQRGLWYNVTEIYGPTF